MVLWRVVSRVENWVSLVWREGFFVLDNMLFDGSVVIMRHGCLVAYI